MKIKSLISSFAAVLCLATHSSAGIVTYLTQTTIPSSKSLKMNWSPSAGWSAIVGSHTGGDPLYLTSAYIDPEYGHQNGYIGSWSGTALSLSTAFIAANAVVGTGLSYFNYIDLTPVDNSLSTYAGLRYDLGGGNYNYGWVNYATNSDSTEITFLGAAFNDTPNEFITAGQGAVAAVPEPSEYLLGGASALLGGFALLRRRASRKAAVAA